MPERYNYLTFLLSGERARASRDSKFYTNECNYLTFLLSGECARALQLFDFFAFRRVCLSIMRQ